MNAWLAAAATTVTFERDAMRNAAKVSICAAIAVTAAAAGGPATRAHAGIKCLDGYQLVAGNYLATPYCQDGQLADVARQYGIRTSAAEIRENPNHKRHVCRIVGRDIRVMETCLTVNPRRGGL